MPWQFQLSLKGQKLQARFVETYAERLHGQIEGDLRLPEFAPVTHLVVSGTTGRARDAHGRGTVAVVPKVDPSAISEEVRAAQTIGKAGIRQSRGNLETASCSDKGASEEAADEVKKW